MVNTFATYRCHDLKMHNMIIYLILNIQYWTNMMEYYCHSVARGTHTHTHS